MPFDRHISRPDTAKERISEFQNMPIKAFQIEMQTEKILSLVFNSIRSPSHHNQTRKRNKRNSDWKERNKTATICRQQDTTQRIS